MTTRASGVFLFKSGAGSEAMAGCMPSVARTIVEKLSGTVNVSAGGSEKATDGSCLASGSFS